MSMIDYMLRFASQEEMAQVLAPLYVQDVARVMSQETGEWYDEPISDPYLPTTTHDFAIDVIGAMEGALDEWHVNVRLAGPHPIEAAIAPYAVTPATPNRTWA